MLDGYALFTLPCNVNEGAECVVCVFVDLHVIRLKCSHILIHSKKIHVLVSS